MGKEENILKALLDLRIALGELHESISDIDRAIQKLMLAQLEILESKNKATNEGQQ